LAGKTGPLDTETAEETSSGTYSEEDEEGSDDHQMAKIRHALVMEVAIMAGETAILISVQGTELPREQLGVEVVKKGEGIRVVYSRANQKGPVTGNFHAQMRAQFPEALSVIYGIQKEEKNWDITRRLEEITASWFGDQYGPSWNVNLSAQERRLEEGG
jgi:hypothetical protein